MSRVAPYLDQPDLDPTIGGAASTRSADRSPTSPGTAGPYEGDRPPSTIELLMTSLQLRLKTAEKLAGQLGEYVGHLLRVKADKAMLAVRSILIWSMVGITAAAMGAAAIIYATVLLLSGIAGGLGALFGGRVWLGQLLTGLLVAGAILITVLMVARSLVGKSEKALHAKYDAIKAAQKEKFGRDVHQAAGV